MTRRLRPIRLKRHLVRRSLATYLMLPKHNAERYFSLFRQRSVYSPSHVHSDVAGARGQRRQYSPAVRLRLKAGRLSLATALVVCALLLTATGGLPGLVLGGAQAALAVAIVIQPASPWPAAWAVMALLPGPLLAARHWTAGLPGACHCARLRRPPPALVSLTGLAVVVDLAVLALALWLIAATHRAATSALAER